ncbi:MAG: ATP-binding protein [Myxococcota bacterium]
MSLRLRLILLFLVAAFVPFGALGVVVRQGLIQNLEDDYARQLEARIEGAQVALERREAEDRRAVDALCADELVVDRTLLQLAGDRFGPAAERSLVALLPPLMRSRGFDTLHLIDAGRGRGRILGAAHFAGEAGSDGAPLLDALARRGDRTFIAELRVEGSEGPESARALILGCVAERDGEAVALLAGRRLGPDFATNLLGDARPVAFELTDGEPNLPGSGEAREVFRWSARDGAPDLVLYANLDDAPLRAEVSSLQRRSVLVALAAVALALVMALLFTSRLVRPIRSLEAAAQRVAQGDLQSQVEIGRRDEVGSAMTAFNAMTRELAATREKLLRAERIAAWREVARRIAHEIKNPLQPIQMEIETMRKLHARGHPSFGEDFEASTQLILDEVKRLNTMVTEFSRFARLPPPKPEHADLAEVLQHVADLHESSGAVETAIESVRVRHDREQLTQVLVNLVQNASDAATARHGESGARVRLSMAPRKVGETLLGADIRVEDNGTGIAPADRLRIFEPYFTTKATGTGLGLAIVHRIVGDHNGTIDVQDGIDGGAAFVLFLPLAGPTPAIAASLSDASLPLGRGGS